MKFRKLRVKLFTLRLRIVKLLSESFSWSALATIGQSPLVRLTIIMPFIGYILLFNANLQNYLNVSIEHVIDIVGRNGDQYQQENITSSRLNFLYFGLVFVGFASSLYSIFSPREIKKHPLPADYISYIEPIATKNLTRTALERVLSAFMASDTAEGRSPMSALTSRSFPAIASNRLHSFIQSVFHETDYGVDEHEDDIKSNDDFYSQIHSGSGNLLTDVILEKMWANRRIEWAFIEPLFETAMKYKKDVFYIEHLTLDHSHFGLRCCVAFFYGIGFTLLLLPTIDTTMRLAANWLWR